MFTKIAHLPKLSKFLDLSETGSCPAPKGGVRLSEVGLRPTSLNLTKTFDGAGVPKLVRGPMR